jgi:hypothetical protein
MQSQIGWWAAALALVGLVALAVGWVGRARWDALCLAVALSTTYGFGVFYRVADVEVFFIPAFLCTALALAAGMAAAQEGWERGGRRPWTGDRGPETGDRKPEAGGWRPVVLGAIGLALIVIPARERFPQMDLSQRWEIHDLGVDMLSQPLPENSTIVGILGETTLVRYFQFAHGMQPDVQVIAADREEARFAAIDRLLSESRPVFLTRPLAGAEDRYALGAVGPLIRVWPQGASRWDALPMPMDQPLGQGVRLAGSLIEMKMQRGGRLVRLTLHWQADGALADRLKVSARLTTPTDDKVVTADEEPVHMAYPTTAWSPGETVQDVYDLRVPPTVAAGTYDVLLILYRAEDGSEIGRARLGAIDLPPP